MNSASERTLSLPLIGAVLLAFATLYLSTQSPFVLVLPVLYLAPLALSSRLERDASAIWGLRLFVYGALALLGRADTGQISYFYDARAYTTLGLVMGGELIIQAFRKAPRELRFDPNQILLAALIFVVACNTRRPHLIFLAPPFIACLLLALGDLRPRVGRMSWSTRAFKAVFIGATVLVGALLHGLVAERRGAVEALGARLLAGRNFNVQASGQEVGDNPELSSTFNANASTARLLRIEGFLRDPHLRTAAFHEYIEGAWGPKISSRAIVPALPIETNEQIPGSIEFRTDYNAKITVLRPTRNNIFAPLNATALVPITNESFNWDRFAGPLQVNEDEAPPFTYGIVESEAEIGSIQIAQGPLTVAPDAQQRFELLEIPAEIDPRVVDLAQEVTIEARNDGEKAALITEYLFENYKYSLEFVRGEQDPISDFLLNKKAAHCQYFAAGAVMMLRAVGIPARYASGFWAHESASDGTTIVRGRDAHAWAEAYVTGVGWINVDATPPQGRADPRAAPLPWYQRALEWAQDSLTNVRAWFGRLTNVQIFGMMVVMLALWGLERARQAWKKRRKAAKSPVPTELQPYARRFERALQKRGITLLANRPWSESIPEDWNAAQEWVALYNRLRFSQSQDQGEFAELDEELREIEKTK